MSRNVGVLRDAAGLRDAMRALHALRERALGEGSTDLRNRAETALLIAASAYQRRESRGGHFRKDFPQADSAKAHRSFITLDEALTLARRIATSEAA
jgi:L-aspartate oxidase